MCYPYCIIEARRASREHVGHLERPARVDVILGDGVDELVPVQLLLLRLALRIRAAHALPPAIIQRCLLSSTNFPSTRLLERTEGGVLCAHHSPAVEF